MFDTYEPAEDSYLILKHIKDYAKGKRVLDMGTGSGILLLEAQKYAKSVTGVDINKQAIQALRKKHRVKLIVSNLFENVKGKFEVILFNPPYLPSEQPDDIALDGGKHGYEIILRFLKQARHYLAKKGVILLVFSSLSNRARIDRGLSLLGYKHRLVEMKKLFFEELYLYEIKRDD